MSFSQIVSVSGSSSVYKLVSTKNNGIIVTNLEDNKSSFISSRTQHITALENIAIYREHDETTPLSEVLMKMEEMESKFPVPSHTESHDALKKYAATILPDIDQVRVHYSDLKKLVKWYKILKQQALLPKKEDEKTESVVEEKVAEAPATEVKEAKPKRAKKAKE
jgi:hypothetical protein